MGHSHEQRGWRHRTGLAKNSLALIALLALGIAPAIADSPAPMAASSAVPAAAGAAGASAADTSAAAPAPDENVPWAWQFQIHYPHDGSDDSGDPIGPLANRMGRVVTDLAAQETDQPVQVKQKQISSTLDTLIAELDRECKSGNGGANPNPTKPMTRSVLAGGPGGSGPLHDPHAGSRVWAQLPPKERDQILQSQTEGFPAGYESVLANYYTRLAQSQDADSPSSDHAATTQPVNP